MNPNRQRRWACVAVLSCVFSADARAADAQPQAAGSPAYRRAATALSAKQFKEAQALFADLARQPAEAARALHGKGVCELYLDDVKAAKASLEKAVQSAASVDRALAYNYAIALSKSDALPAAGESIRKYLFAHPEPADEPLLNGLGTVLQAMARTQNSDLKARDQLQAFYDAYNDRVEKRVPGMKRWGERWEPEAVVAESAKSRQERADRVAVLRKDLDLIRLSVVEYRQELARNRKQSGGVRRTGDMDRKLSTAEDELRQKQVELKQAAADLLSAEPRFSGTLFPLPLDATVPPKAGDAVAEVAEATPKPDAPPVAVTPEPSPTPRQTPAGDEPADPKPATRPAAAAADKPTDDGVTGHAYAVSDKPMSFEAAKKYCADQGGTLVTIQGEKENAFVQRLTARRGDNQIYWIGLAAPRPNAWKWVTGRPAAYKNWAPREPNEKTTSLAAGLWSEHGLWTDERADARNFAVCEWTDPAAAPAEADVVVADADALDGTAPHEVVVPAGGGPGSRACSLGTFKRGQTLMIQYVQGQWSAYPRQGLGSPDEVPLRSNVLPVTLCQVVNGTLAKVTDVPGNTAEEPFEFKIERPGVELFLNMQDPSPNNNAGAVTYRIWVKK